MGFNNINSESFAEKMTELVEFFSLGPVLLTNVAIKKKENPR